MGRNSEALAAARAAAAAAPEDPGTRKELQRCEQKANRDRSVERHLAKRMLGTTDPPKGGAPDKKPSRAKVIIPLLRERPNSKKYVKKKAPRNYWAKELNSYVLLFRITSL
jgi:hypothetical protein